MTLNISPSTRKVATFVSGGIQGTTTTSSRCRKQQHKYINNDSLFQRQRVCSFASSLNYDMITTTTSPTNVLLATTTQTSPPPSFEPIYPDNTTIIGMVSVVLLCAIAAYVWNTQVVPVSRTKLAISKSRGDVKDYLDELRTTSGTDDMVVDRDIDSNEAIDHQKEDEYATDTAATTDPTASSSSSSSSSKKNNDIGRNFERWLFTDWLQQLDDKETKGNKNVGGRKKEPALPILKDAKWNSGDNPIVVTSGIMLIGVIIASITERVTSL